MPPPADAEEAVDQLVEAVELVVDDPHAAASVPKEPSTPSVTTFEEIFFIITLNPFWFYTRSIETLRDFSRRPREAKLSLQNKR